MKTTKKIVSLLLALSLVLTLAVSASAAWPVYGGNDNHNAVVSGACTASSTSPAGSVISLGSNSGWDGIDNVPVMQTVTNSDNTKTTYAYVLFDGKGSIGAQVAKVNCTDNQILWKTPAQQNPNSLNAKSGFQLSTPYLDEATGTLYVGVISTYTYDETTDTYLQNTKGKILALTDLDNANGPTVKEVLLNIDGQINTPIVKYGNYIYFGTWSGNSAYPYYQVNVNTGAVRKFTPASNGFYWAGAVSDGTNIYFGSDSGKLYWRSISDFGNENTAGTGGVLDLATATGGASDVGNIRSTVMRDGSNLYFTSQGGYLWCCKFDADFEELTISWKASLGGTSTSTPTKVGNRIYVGYYSGFNAGGVKCVSVDGSSVQTVASGFPVQCSILVQGNGSGTDHVYFNTNSSTGCGYCYSYDGSVGTEEAPAGIQVWKTANDTYALGGMAYDNGYLVFGNDYDHLYIVK